MVAQLDKWPPSPIVWSNQRALWTNCASKSKRKSTYRSRKFKMFSKGKKTGTPGRPSLTAEDILAATEASSSRRGSASSALGDASGSSAGINALECNPISQYFEIDKLVASAGPELAWKIYSAIRRDDRKVGSSSFSRTLFPYDRVNRRGDHHLYSWWSRYFSIVSFFQLENFYWYFLELNFIRIQTNMCAAVPFLPLIWVDMIIIIIFISSHVVLRFPDLLDCTFTSRENEMIICMSQSHSRRDLLQAT